MIQKDSRLIIFGTGYMAFEYTKVLKALKKNFIVVGRGFKSAKTFQEKTDIIPLTGGANKFLLSNRHNFSKAIVAVSGDQLKNVTLELIKHGFKSILVEKPGGLNYGEIKAVAEASIKHHAEVYIAYNRRFYASTQKAQEIIKKDGGILSFHFEFNEPGYKIKLLENSVQVRHQWLLHNSTHVIDLAFFLGGAPKTLESNTFGHFSWHPQGAIFTGSGVSINNLPFTYHANWQGPGRWGLEVVTKNHRLIFRPFEKLQVQKRDSFEIIGIELNDKLDIKFKPGLYKEVQSFLGNKENLCSIKGQANNTIWYRKIQEGK